MWPSTDGAVVFAHAEGLLILNTTYMLAKGCRPAWTRFADLSSNSLVILESRSCNASRLLTQFVALGWQPPGKRHTKSYPTHCYSWPEGKLQKWRRWPWSLLFLKTFKVEAFSNQRVLIFGLQRVARLRGDSVFLLGNCVSQGLPSVEWAFSG